MDTYVFKRLVRDS